MIRNNNRRVGILLVVTLLSLFNSNLNAQCPFGGNTFQFPPATFTPVSNGVAAPVTTCNFGGDYFLMNVVAGNTYTVSTCGGTWDSQITIYNNVNQTVIGYNDDGCGVQSTVTFVATFTGVVRVLISTYPCGTNSTCITTNVTSTGSTPPPVIGNSVTFNFTGSIQNWTVPPCVTSISVVAAGADGGGANGGNGAIVSATIAVTPGQVLQLTVGGSGNCPGAGYNGGGPGANANSIDNNSCGGGGASDIRFSPFATANRVVVASGGGGMGGGTSDAIGSAGGCATGAAGVSPFGVGGGGATQTGAGAGGPPWISSGTAGTSGSATQGGNGASDPCYNVAPGGGGGGGFFGGGGGGSDCFNSGPVGGGSGGGGSSLTPAGGGCTSGTNNGPGYITITYNASTGVATATNTGPYCAGSTIQLNGTGGGTYSWTGPNGFVSNLQNPTISNATAANAGVYTLVTTSGTCTATATTTVVINSTPTMLATPSSQSICSGLSTGIALSSTPVGATFAWTVSQNNASGASAGNGSSIAQVLTATGVSLGTVTYLITPSIGSCVGSPVSVVITVNLAPIVIATPASETICSGQTTGINLTSNPAGSTFSWTVAQNNVSGASTGNGSSINQALTSNPSTSGTATYTITPSLGTCSGIPLNVVITVNPIPTVNATPPSQSICSGLSTGIALSSTPVGATFSWTVSQNNASGATAGSGSSIAQVLTTTGASSGAVTYAITPSIGTCVGSPISVLITVDPAPIVIATPTSQSICSDQTTGINLTSNPAGSTFSWTVAQNNVSGAIAGSGSSINQTLTSNPGTSGTAIYTITPSSGTCPGIPLDVVITVNPIPTVTATPSSQSICSGISTGIALSSTSVGATFSWTVSQNNASGATAGSGSSIAQVLTTTGASSGAVTYAITPSIGACVGSPISALITVDPAPIVIATPTSETICSGQTAGINLTSNPTGSTFSWTVAQNNVSGAIAGSGSSINQTLTSNPGTSGTAIYTITPSSGSCPGIPLDVVITVNPIPTITATPSSQSICSGVTTGITLSSTPVGATFAWTVSQNNASGASAGSGSSILQTLINSSTSVGSVTYAVTPSIGACVGSPIDVVITVNPAPSVVATPASQTICNGTSTGISLSSVPLGATFAWTVVESNVTGGSAGTGASVNQSLSLSSGTAGSATYTVTPSSSGCPGVPTDVVISVSAGPSVVALPETICSGATTGLALSSNPAGASFNWTMNQTDVSGASVGSGNSIAQTLNATSSNIGNVVYTVTANIGACIGAPLDVPIFVNPIPVVTANPAVQTICSATSTAINLSSTPAGATFDWTVNQVGASGASAGAGSNINQILSSTSTAVGTVTYTVTPTLNGCVGSPIDVVITVNPIPIAIATPALQTICSGATTSIALSSSPVGSTFGWTASESLATGSSAGTGSNIAQVLNTTSNNTGTVTYSVTPTLNGCIGSPVDVVITIGSNPIATATPAIQTICEGTSTGIALSSTPAGATYAWTVSQIGTTGASGGTGSNIAQTLNAIGIVPGTVTYTITPNIGTCVGSPIDVVITVNPLPVAIANPISQAICSGTSTSITLSSSPAGASLAWTVAQSGTTGATGGNGTSIVQVLDVAGLVSGTTTYTVTPTLLGCVGLPIDIPITVNPTPVVAATPTTQTICSATSPSIALSSTPTGAGFSWTVSESGTSGASAASGFTINQTLSATGLTQGTATYTVSPTLGACIGAPLDVPIFVNPIPTAIATPAIQTICSGTAIGITLSSTPVGSTFAWTVNQVGASGASAGSGNGINQVLSSTSTAVGTVTYTVTPTLNGCVGSPINIVITVNPIPTAIATPPSETICSGATTSIALSSSPVGSTFGWTASESLATGSSAGTGPNIAQVLNTTSSNTGTVTYSVTPTLSGCIGSPVDVVITIGSNPIAIATPASQTICEGTSTGIALSSLPAGATYAWTVSQIGTTGAIGGTGSNIAQTLNAIGIVPGTVTYTITPNIGTCVGSPIDVVITVNPLPVAIANPISQAICSGTSTSITLSSSPAGASLAWTVAQSGTTGATGGNGTSIVQVLDVAGLVSGTTTYTVTPTLLGCVGLPIDIPITVNPTPVVAATPTTQTICSATSPSIALSSTPTGAGFSWTVSESGTSGASAASSFIINQTLSATGLTQGTATYTVSPTLGACIGAPLDVPIYVNPIPVVTATPAVQTICSGTAANIVFSSSPVGSTFDWTVNQVGASGASAGSGNGINQVLSSTSTAVGTVTYTVTPTLNGCVGSPIDVVITVNPIPTAIATPPSETICSGATTSIALSSSPVGSTFGWTASESLATGSSAGAGSNIAQVLNTTSSNTGTVTYSVTPTLNGCIGSPIAVVVSVNPNPIVTATPALQTICEGTSTGIALSSLPAGATFNWTSSETNVTGSIGGTGASIAQILDATALVPGTVTYTINSNIGLCVGLPVDVIVTVNPLPTAIASPVSQTICSTTSTSINLSSSPVGASLAWTVSESGTSGASAGSGPTIAQTLDVTGLVSGTTTYTVTPTLSGCVGLPIDIPITVNPTPTAIATPTTQTICSETAFLIDLSSSPVGSTFEWTATELGETGANAGAGSTISEVLTVIGITQGTATYTITPTLGACAGLPIDVPILVNPIPVVTALALQDTICSATSNSITMNSVPVGANFDWTSVDNLVTGSSGGVGNSISQVLTSTSTAVGSSIYTITPTLTGCVGLPVDVEITVNPLPTVIATPSDETLCSGQTSEIILTSSPAGSAFNWTVLSANVLGSSNGGGDTIAQTLTSIVTGTSTYTIIPTLNGCTGPSSNVVVTVNPNPTLVTNIGQGTLCAGSSISMDVSGAVSYVWSPATGLDTNLGDAVVATPASTQTYFITGTDINNCSSIDSIAITVNPIPVTTVTLNGTICEGLSINLDANGADSYAWTPSTGLNSITDSSIVASPLVTTTYTVTGTSLNCSSTATVTVSVNPAPTINAGVDSLICYGNSIVLSGSGGVSYAWSGGVVDNVPFFPTATQTYTVVGTDANQCQDSDLVVVSITPLPIIDLVPSITSGCVPQAVDFQNNTIGAVAYNWDFGDGNTSTMTNPSNNYTSTGCYDITLTASTSNGCTFTTTYPSMVCIELTPVASFYANPSQITTDYPVSTMVNTSQDAVAYSWDFGDGTMSTVFMPEHTFPGSDITTYTVELVAYSLTGCTDTARVNIQVYEDIVYFVPNTFTPDGDNFNQTFKPVFTSGYDPYDYALFIYNRWGQVIFESHDASVGWDGTYGDAGGIVMDGTYVWTIEFKVTQTSERKKIEGHVNVLR